MLTGVGAEATPDGTPVAAPERVGPQSAALVASSETVIPMPLSELIADERTIVVYQSDEAMDRVVACGNVGGLLSGQMPGDELAVWLGEEAGSGLSGVALLEAAGRATVDRVYLGEGLGGRASVAAEDRHAEATPTT